MNFICKVHKPYLTRNNKKYLELELSEKDAKNVLLQHTKSKHFIQNEKIKNPLEENILEVKVPFRYNKISCKVTGNKTIQELQTGDTVIVELKYCGVWNIGEWSGFAWKIESLTSR